MMKRIPSKPRAMSILAFQQWDPFASLIFAVGHGFYDFRPLMFGYGFADQYINCSGHMGLVLLWLAAGRG